MEPYSNKIRASLEIELVNLKANLQRITNDLDREKQLEWKNLEGKKGEAKVDKSPRRDTRNLFLAALLLLLGVAVILLPRTLTEVEELLGDSVGGLLLYLSFNYARKWFDQVSVDRARKETRDRLVVEGELLEEHAEELMAEAMERGWNDRAI